MFNIFFYCDPGLIQKQTATNKYGPIDNSPEQSFRVTNLHSSSVDNPAYAVCDGFLFMQAGEGDTLNLILKPLQDNFGNDIKVQYIIYKGIKKSSLLESDGKSLIQNDNIDLLRLVWQNHLRLEEDRTLYQESSEPKPDAEKIFKLNSLDQQESIDNLYYNYDPAFQPFIVKAGADIGSFQETSFSVQFCAEPLGKPLNNSEIQSIDSIISYSEHQGGITTAQSFAIEKKKQKVLSFYDASSFYSGYVESGVNIITGGVESKVYGAELYEKVLAKFGTCQTIYINLDCIESRDFSTADYLSAGIKLNHSASSLQLTRKTDSWPLCIVDCSSWGSDKVDGKSIELKLILNEQLNLNSYLQSSFIPKQLQNTQQKSKFAKLSVDENTLEADEVELILPVVDESGSLKVLGGHFHLILKKRESWFQPLTDDDSASQNESRPEHYLNQLFYPFKHSSLLPSGSAKSQMRFSQQNNLLENGVDFQGVFNCKVAICKDATHYYFMGCPGDHSISEYGFISSGMDMPETRSDKDEQIFSNLHNDTPGFYVTHTPHQIPGQVSIDQIKLEISGGIGASKKSSSSPLPCVSFTKDEMESMKTLGESQEFMSPDLVSLSFRKSEIRVTAENYEYCELEVFLTGPKMVNQEIKQTNVSTGIKLIDFAGIINERS